MDIRMIREFLVLAECGNFLEASERLFISQSSLSRHIKSLEEELGAPLFDRTTRRVALNRFGELFLPYAKELEQIRQAYTAALRSQLDAISGSILIGSIPMMTPYGITDLLAQFRREHKNIQLQLADGDSLELLKRLKNGALDLAFIRSGLPDPKITGIPVAEDTLAAVLPVSHPLAARDSLALRQLRQEKLLLLSPDTLLYNICADACGAAGFAPKVEFTGRRERNLIDFVSKGMGIALLMKKAALTLLPEGLTIRELSPAVRSDILLAWNRERELAEPAREFIDFVRKTAAQIGPSLV